MRVLEEGFRSGLDIFLYDLTSMLSNSSRRKNQFGSILQQSKEYPAGPTIGKMAAVDLDPVMMPDDQV